MSHTHHDHDHHHHDHDPSRRRLLKSGLAVTAGQVGIPFALNLANMGAAAAQSSGGDYKALVCLFLNGGNDQANTVIATRGSSWTNYQKMRAYGSGLGLPEPGKANGMLPITPHNMAEFGNSALTLALHPKLVRTRELFQANKLAILANVGPLIEPTTAEEYMRQTTRVPRRLFSHNDQQSTWQTFSPEGSASGWGGRMVDRLASSFNASASFFSAISPGNDPSPWLVGQRISPYAIPTSGTIGIRQINLNLGGIPNNGQPLRDLLNLNRSGSTHIENTLAMLNQRTMQYQQIVSEGLVSENAAGLLPVPNYSGGGGRNILAEQFRMIARIIASRNNLGVRRQVFFVQMGGFDTHNDQLFMQNRLLSRLDDALGFFSDQMRAIGVENQVTLFTASDFGRSMVNNGNGSDHGWGSHHFILGGAVKGGRLYGKFPEFGLDAGNDANGRLVPHYSVAQYAAALGAWFGLSQSELLDILPNLGNFGAAPGFMRT